jgi:hypothetical protein
MNTLMLIAGVAVGAGIGFATGWQVALRGKDKNWREKIPEIEAQMQAAHFRDLDKVTKELEGQDVMKLVNRFGFKWRRFMLEAYKVDKRLVAARNEFHLLMAEWDGKLGEVLAKIEKIKAERGVRSHDTGGPEPPTTAA